MVTRETDEDSYTSQTSDNYPIQKKTPQLSPDTIKTLASTANLSLDELDDASSDDSSKYDDESSEYADDSSDYEDDCGVEDLNIPMLELVEDLNFPMIAAQSVALAQRFVTEVSEMMYNEFFAPSTTDGDTSQLTAFPTNGDTEIQVTVKDAVSQQEVTSASEIHSDCLGTDNESDAKVLKLSPVIMVKQSAYDCLDEMNVDYDTEDKKSIVVLQPLGEDGKSNFLAHLQSLKGTMDSSKLLDAFEPSRRLRDKPKF